jgi:hypothetical protein
MHLLESLVQLVMDPGNVIIVLERDIPEKMENVAYVMELENVLLVKVQGYIDV